MADYTDDFDATDFDVGEGEPEPPDNPMHGYYPPALHRLDRKRREALKKRRRRHLSDIYNTNLN